MANDDVALLRLLMSLHTCLDKRGLTLLDALPELIRLVHKAASEDSTDDGIRRAFEPVDLATPPSDEPGKIPEALERLTLDQWHIKLQQMQLWIHLYLDRMEQEEVTEQAKKKLLLMAAHKRAHGIGR